MEKITIGILAKMAGVGVFGEGETTCCYAESTKAWVKDPSGIAWEAYHSMADVELYNKKEKSASAPTKSCC